MVRFPDWVPGMDKAFGSAWNLEGGGPRVPPRRPKPRNACSFVGGGAGRVEDSDRLPEWRPGPGWAFGGARDFEDGDSKVPARTWRPRDDGSSRGSSAGRVEDSDRLPEWRPGSSWAFSGARDFEDGDSKVPARTLKPANEASVRTSRGGSWTTKFGSRSGDRELGRHSGGT